MIANLYSSLNFHPPLHSVGHNLGGQHPFYDWEIINPGETGGIMDYSELRQNLTLTLTLTLTLSQNLTLPSKPD